MERMTNVFLSLGSNQGNKNENLSNAISLIAKLSIEVVRTSSLYKTKAWGKTDQDDFLNQVIEIKTCYDAKLLLTHLLSIEEALGRVRDEKWGPRIIDIDILFYDNAIIHEYNLIVPHPAIAERRFILTPLHEIAPNFVHPVHKKEISTLLNECTDLLEVQRVEA